jgi:predicted Zn-dependent protease
VVAARQRAAPRGRWARPRRGWRWRSSRPLATDEGVRRDVGKESKFTKLVPAEQVEQAAAQQYAQMLKQAAQQRGLAPDSHPQVQRLRYIAQRLIPFAQPWNERSRQWRWEVNLLGSKDLNAFCMPGGKIAFYFGILAQLQLTDDEVATIMGHEIAHALREHARERMGKTAAASLCSAPPAPSAAPPCRRCCGAGTRWCVSCGRRPVPGGRPGGPTS